MSFDKGSIWYADNYWVGFTASAAITKGQVVVLGSTGQVSPAAGVDSKAIGVALADAASGALVPIALRGIVWVTASGAISQGAFVTSAANGQVAAFVAFDAPATYAEADMQTQLNKIGTVIGVALDAASAAGDKIRMLLLNW